MKILAESVGDDLVLDIFRNKDSNSDTKMKLLNHQEAIGVLIISLADINEIICRTNDQDTDKWFSLSEEERQKCAASLMRNVFCGVKDQIEYAISDNFATQMTLTQPTES